MLNFFGISMPWLQLLPLFSVDMNWILHTLIFGLGGFIYRLPWLEREENEDE